MRTAPRGARRHLRTALPVAIVGVVVVAALGSTLLGHDTDLAQAPDARAETTDASTTADALGSLLEPAPGVARPPAPVRGAYSGFILATRVDTCAVAGWNLTDARPTESSGTACAFVLSADSGWVALTTSKGDGLADAPLDRIGFDDEVYQRAVLVTGPTSLGDVALANDGTLADCSLVDGAEGTTVVGPSGRKTVAEGCSPVAVRSRILIAPGDGSALAADIDGRVVIRRSDVDEPPIGRVVLGAGRDGLVGVVARRAPDRIAMDVVRLAARDGERPAVLATRVMPARDPTALRLAPGGQAAAFREVGSRGWTLVAWAPDGTPTTLASVEGYGPVLDVSFAPGGRTAAVATPAAVLLVDLASLAPVATVPIGGGARSVAWLPAAG